MGSPISAISGGMEGWVRNYNSKYLVNPGTKRENDAENPRVA